MWDIESGKIKIATVKESCIPVFCGLISYQAMGASPQNDFHVDVLKYAIKCVEENGEQ
jgi:hypothetical protein|nr:MAG TPA: hypothetical protein [Caudoviricetes sp.]